MVYEYRRGEDAGDEEDGVKSAAIMMQTYSPSVPIPVPAFSIHSLTPDMTDHSNMPCPNVRMFGS